MKCDLFKQTLQGFHHQSSLSTFATLKLFLLAMTKISVGAPLSHKPTNLKRVRPMKQVIQNLQEPYAAPKLSSPSKRRRLLCCLVSETRHAVQSLITQSPEVLATPNIRMRTSFTYSQLQTLEEIFSEQSRISRLYAEQIAEKFKLPVECITSWFSNRRDLQRKRDQRKVDNLITRKNIIIIINEYF